MENKKIFDDDHSEDDDDDDDDDDDYYEYDEDDYEGDYTFHRMLKFFFCKNCIALKYH